MGRPPLDGEPMTASQRQKRWRQKRRGLLPNEKKMANELIIRMLREEIRELKAKLKKLGVEL